MLLVILLVIVLLAAFGMGLTAFWDAIVKRDGTCYFRKLKALESSRNLYKGLRHLCLVIMNDCLHDSSPGAESHT
jgi:hypothetical protein